MLPDIGKEGGGGFSTCLAQIQCAGEPMLSAVLAGGPRDWLRQMDRNTPGMYFGGLDLGANWDLVRLKGSFCIYANETREREPARAGSRGYQADTLGILEAV